MKILSTRSTGVLHAFVPEWLEKCWGVATCYVHRQFPERFGCRYRCCAYIFPVVINVPIDVSGHAR